MKHEKFIYVNIVKTIRDIPDESVKFYLLKFMI